MLQVTTLRDRLLQASRSINQARDDLRRTANKIAGCDLSDWSFQEVEGYMDLFIQTARRELNRIQYGKH